MPVSAVNQIQAQVSDYQNNGALNALVHVLTPHIIGNSLNDPRYNDSKAEFCKAFYEEWGHYLSWAEIRDKLNQVTHPLAREQLLGPVLRRMLPLSEQAKKEQVWQLPSKTSVAALAWKFGIQIHSYTTPEGLKTKIRQGLLAESSTLELLKIKAKNVITAKIAGEGLSLAAQADKIASEMSKMSRKKINGVPNEQEAFLDYLVAHEFDLIMSGGTSRFSRFPGANFENAVPWQDGYSVEPNSNNSLFLLESETACHFFSPHVLQHNAAYENRTVGAYETTAPELKALLDQSVSDAITLDKNGAVIGADTAIKNTDFRKIFKTHEQKSKEQIKPSENTFEQMFNGVIGGVDKFFNSKDISNPLAGLMKIFESLIGPLMRMMFGLKEQVEEMFRKPDDPLRPEEMQQEPAMGLGVSDFAEAVAEINQAGEAGAQKARALNTQWRAQFDKNGALKEDAHMTDLWVNTVTALVKHSDMDAASDLLASREDKLIKDLEKLQQSLRPFLNANSENDLTADQLKELLQQYQTKRDELLKPQPQSTPTQVLQARLVHFKDYSTKLEDICKTHQKLIARVELKNRLKNEQALLRKQVESSGENQDVLQSLTERLRQVCEAFDVTNEAVENLALEGSRKIITHFAAQSQSGASSQSGMWSTLEHAGRSLLPSAFRS